MKTIPERARIAVHKLEIRFWDAFIPLMRKSPTIRFFVPRIYRLFRIKEIHKTAGLILLLSILGMLAGFILGALSQI